MIIIGVGPGDPDLISVKGKKAIEECQVIVGWGSVIDRFNDIIGRKEVIKLSYKKESDGLEKASKLEKQGIKICVLDHGDPGVSDWQFIDKLRLYFEKVSIIPGISVVNAALDELGEDLGRNCFVTLHVRGEIDKFLKDIISCLEMERGVLVNPEPYPDGPQRVAKFLLNNNINAKIIVLENLTLSTFSRSEFTSTSLSTSERKFSDLSIMHVKRIDRNKS
ncbi:precorrin-6y C5,15-methyltransferase (decarboxylating) subunit CbiE [Sulfuracidifex metallicus]|uniref:precorrin-6y C5,15-methyltransferase (decarboxylating) subunit CbiE n=1 Tax=Sulfuracidifex metallicus TaxID=47303 RepID=UPI002275756C|nr:precorrin-6y C5,15-methyltransferase (decarboxylating) subunit CbiE [Sulfuracidifex metallicus]MCY0850658.1 precorrin-6y C5,15-methyltransferase (decarboxylating) subunit CbiE [Sulfuracidifex metallicus]